MKSTQSKHLTASAWLFHSRGIALISLALSSLVALLGFYPLLSARSNSAYAADPTPAAEGISITLDTSELSLSSGRADANGFVYDTVTSSVTSASDAGYNLYMSASGKDATDAYTASLVNQDNKSYQMATLSGNISLPYTTVSDARVYNSANFTANSWGYSVAKDTDPANTAIFYPIPLDEDVINNTSAIFAERERASNIHSSAGASGGDGTSADAIEVTIAARSNNTIPAGNYANTLVFTALANPAPYIAYDSNAITGASDNPSGDMTMVRHEGIVAGSTITLYAPNYWRTGYGFLGWSFEPAATSYVPVSQASLSTGQAYIYGPNETITITDEILSRMDEDGQIKLYAIWQASAGNLQGWAGCSSMSNGSVTALTDTRDNNVYTVAKLADGKCWTAENLRLSSGTISDATTNNPVSGFAWTASSNSWCTDNNATCDDKVVLNTNNINSSLTASPSTNNNSSSWYGYGVYYNWYTATAGNGKYATTSGNTSGDLCPAGWHVATSTDSGEFQTMYTAIGAAPANIRKYPNNFILSGSWGGSYASSRGSSGYHWSSTTYSDNRAYGLSFDSGRTNQSDNYNKYVGFPLRCLADNRYTIKFNANGGSGTTAAKENVAAGTKVTLSNGFSRTGYTFAGWALSSSATTADYAKDASVQVRDIASKAGATTDKAEITLYAIWTVNSHTVSVTKGTGVSGTATGTGSKNYGTTVTLGGISAATGYHGLKWSTSDATLSSTTATNPTFTMPDKNVSVTVSSTANTYTISYDANGGTGTTMDNSPATYNGQNVTLRTNTYTRSGYSFLGWSLDKTATAASYGDGASIKPNDIAADAGVTNTNNGSIKLWAVWKSTECSSSTAVGETCKSNGVEFIRLKDNNFWTKSSQGSSNWSGAASKCSSGTHLPSADEFTKLLTAYGGTKNTSYGKPYGWHDGDADLYNATGWFGYHWSSTEYASDTDDAWSLYVYYSLSNVRDVNKPNSLNVVCIKS